MHVIFCWYSAYRSAAVFAMRSVLVWWLGYMLPDAVVCRVVLAVVREMFFKGQVITLVNKPNNNNNNIRGVTAALDGACEAGEHSQHGSPPPLCLSPASGLHHLQAHT